jgi:polysaccharide deacetylase family protein (PEP-CTERM system associated)
VIDPGLGAPSTNRCAFTIDVEDYFQVDALSSVIATERWDGFQRRVENNTGVLLDLLDQTSTKATFFVLGWIAEREPRLIRRIAGRGHEIASHGQSHRRIMTQTPAEFRAETRHSKRVLEDLVERPVIGYRAATYSITKRSLWALDILQEEGFRYDSSIFPIKHDRYGIGDAPVAPHVLRTPRGRELVEFPMTSVKVWGMNVPVSGGGYFRLFPYAVTRWGLRRALGEGRAVVFYLHPWEVDPGQPVVAGLSWKSRFRHYQNLHETQARLGRLLRDFKFTTMNECLVSAGLLAG